MEHKIGTRITLEVEEIGFPSCVGCFFKSRFDCIAYGVKCLKYERTDHKNIIYKEIKED